MGKVLWFDVESDGLDLAKNSIVRMAGQVEIDGQVKEEFDIKARPAFPQHISEEALAINHLTAAEILAYPSFQSARIALEKVISRYVDKFNRNDKFYIAGKNVGFDTDRLRELFRRCGDNYYGSWFWPVTIEVQTTMAEAVLAGVAERQANWQLGPWCEALGIGIEAHNALSDVKASRELYRLLKARLLARALEKHGVGAAR